MGETAAALRAMGEDTWALSPSGALEIRRGAMRPAVPPHTVRAMLSAGLMVLHDGRVKRTEEGRAFVRRALAGGGARGEAMPFASQHRAMHSGEMDDGGTPLTVNRNAAESPLGWLARRKDKAGRPFIDDTQLAAGERLHRDFTRGHQVPRVTQSWDASAVRGSGARDGMLMTEAAEEARRKVERALAAVGPGDLSDALRGVCCEELGIEEVERRCGWPARSGKLVLRIALHRLAAHYGMAPAAQGAAAPTMLQWGTHDYRPRA